MQPDEKVTVLDCNSKSQNIAGAKQELRHIRKIFRKLSNIEDTYNIEDIHIHTVHNSIQFLSLSALLHG